MLNCHHLFLSSGALLQGFWVPSSVLLHDDNQEALVSISADVLITRNDLHLPKVALMNFSTALLWTAPEESRAPDEVGVENALVANLICGAGCFATAANGWCATGLFISSGTVLVFLVGTACVELFLSQSF
jgi:hypothetical protein